jgi:2-oxoisovalerate dehydrogenase E1 component
MLFNFMNNFYGMGGRLTGRRWGLKVLAACRSASDPEAHARRAGATGYNPLAARRCRGAKKYLFLLAGRGPVLLDTVTYGFSGHSPSDASAYRTKGDGYPGAPMTRLIG